MSFHFSCFKQSIYLPIEHTLDQIPSKHETQGHDFSSVLLKSVPCLCLRLSCVSIQHPPLNARLFPSPGTGFGISLAIANAARNAFQVAGLD
jgi:hypothetical protein